MFGLPGYKSLWIYLSEIGLLLLWLFCGGILEEQLKRGFVEGDNRIYIHRHTTDVTDMPVMYTRGQLFAERRKMNFDLLNPPTLDLKQLGLLRYRGRRSGRNLRAYTTTQRSINTVFMNENVSESLSCIPVVIGRPGSLITKPITRRPRILVRCQLGVKVNSKNDLQQLPSSIYLINSGSLAKPHAKQHLQVYITSIQPDVVIVVESWLSGKHDAAIFQIPGYSLHRRDRCQRKGDGKLRREGGVVMYVRDQYASSIFKPATDEDCSLELLWVMLEKDGRTCYVGGIYHPPNPIFHETSMCQLIEQTLDEIPLGSLVCLAGDFNHLPDSKILSFGLSRIKTPPTRELNNLDKIYTSEPVYEQVVVFNSTITTDHKAIYACAGRDDDGLSEQVKTKTTHTFRRCIPAQNARFLSFIRTNPNND